MTPPSPRACIQERESVSCNREGPAVRNLRISPVALVLAVSLFLPFVMLSPHSFLSQQTNTPPPDMGKKGGGTSRARAVFVCLVNGNVTVKRPDSATETAVLANAPIQEGFGISTSSESFAALGFENDSTAVLGDHTRVRFDQLALDPNGRELTGITFDQGIATFHFLPKRHSPPSGKSPEVPGAVHGGPDIADLYQVKLANATVTADGGCRFRLDVDRNSARVEVFNGKVLVANQAGSTQLSKGQFIDHLNASPQAAFEIHNGITRDAWDRWEETAEQKVLLTARTARSNKPPTLNSHELPRERPHGGLYRVPHDPSQNGGMGIPGGSWRGTGITLGAGGGGPHH